MYMGIDEPRENCRVAEVMDFITLRRYSITGNDALDAFAFR
jgi:hypothetical protein